MIKEAIEKVLSLKEHTDTETTVKLYGNYSEKLVDAKFDKATGNYTIKNENVIKRTVSTVKSFTAAILEESKRRENNTGEKMTVLFTQKGGYFSIDDDFYSGEYKFERTLSQQWQALQEIAGKTLDHEELLTALQELSPSIKDFKELYKKFLKVRIVGASELTSNPVFVNNEAEKGYKVKYTLDGGQADEEVLPEGFTLSLPYSKGSENTYEIAVETMILNNGSGELEIRISCPGLEQIEEKAIFDEVAQVRKDTENLTDLLILESY